MLYLQVGVQRCHSGEMKNPKYKEGHFRIFIFLGIRVKLFIKKVCFAFKINLVLEYSPMGIFLFKREESEFHFPTGAIKNSWVHILYKLDEVVSLFIFTRLFVNIHGYFGHFYRSRKCSKYIRTN